MFKILKEKEKFHKYIHHESRLIGGVLYERDVTTGCSRFIASYSVEFELLREKNEIFPKTEEYLKQKDVQGEIKDTLNDEFQSKFRKYTLDNFKLTFSGLKFQKRTEDGILVSADVEIEADSIFEE